MAGTMCKSKIVKLQIVFMSEGGDAGLLGGGDAGLLMGTVK